MVSVIFSLHSVCSLLILMNLLHFALFAAAVLVGYIYHSWLALSGPYRLARSHQSIGFVSSCRIVTISDKGLISLLRDSSSLMHPLKLRHSLFLNLS